MYLPRVSGIATRIRAERWLIEKLPCAIVLFQNIELVVQYAFVVNSYYVVVLRSGPGFDPIHGRGRKKL